MKVLARDLKEGDQFVFYERPVEALADAASNTHRDWPFAIEVPIRYRDDEGPSTYDVFGFEAEEWIELTDTLVPRGYDFGIDREEADYGPKIGAGNEGLCDDLDRLEQD